MSIFKNTLDRLPLRLLTKLKFLPQDWYVGYSYKYFTGKKLNLDNPIEFNEKIQWLKVFYHRNILNQLVDKYAVREYVKDKIGSQYLNECYGVYDKVSDVDFDKFPNQFVIKATHASSYNLIVKDKNKLNKRKAKQKFRKWLRTSQYYRTGLEWAYKDVKPRIIVEKYLENKESKSLIDYKFYCFNGVPKFVLIIFEEDIKVYKYLDMNWELLPFSGKKIIKYDGVIDMPSNFEEMKEFAIKLAQGFPFVRVDFYSIKDKTIFGEMTFYPTDGRKDFRPDAYNKIIGDYMALPKIPKGHRKITTV